MSIFSAIVNRMGYTKIPTKTMEVENPAPWLLAQAEEAKFDIPEGDLYQSQAELYQRLSWVQIAVRTLAQSSAVVPLQVMGKAGDEETVAIDNHEFELLLQKPNPLNSRFEFLEATFAYRALTGNAYWWMNKPVSGAPPSELWLIPPYQIKPVPDENLYLKGYIYDPGIGDPIAMELHEIVHFKMYHPLSPFVGLSPIEALATVAVGDLKMQKWNTELFGDNNARLPGILAFADMIGDVEWTRILKDTTDKANKRQLMLLRGAGKGGVEWMQAGLGQKDMEFIAGRKFTKQEIFDIYAPGLYTMLFENATEANSKTGKSVFTEYAQWPTLTAISEKITNDVLPDYGDNLIAEFEDIRITDQVLELQQMQEFSKVHTIDEIRKEQYGDDPLGDDRGLLLPLQVGAAPVAMPGEEQPPSEEGPATPPELVGQLFGDGAEVAEEDEEVKAELKAWERYESKRIGKKHRSFECKFVPPERQASIRANLGGVATLDDLEAVFQAETGETVKQDDRVEQLLEGLHSAVRVMRETEPASDPTPAVVVNMPESRDTYQFDVQPASVKVNVPEAQPVPVTVNNEIKVPPADPAVVNVTVPPAETTVVNEVKVPKPAKETTRVTRDSKGRLMGSDSEITYSE